MSSIWESHSRSMIFYIFLYVFLIRVLGSDNLKSFEADKGIEFLPPTKSKKIVRLRVKFFEPVPQLAHLSTCTFPNWHFPQLELFAIFVSSIENLSPPTTGTLFVFILCDIADSRKVVLIEHFFYFWVLFWKVLVIRKDIFYILLFFQKFVRYQKKIDQIFCLKIIFRKNLSLIRAQ